MKTIWIKGLDSQQEIEMKRDFTAAAHLRKRLEVILIEKYKANQQETRNKAGYESPSWAYFQADSRGYERAIFEIISLISSLDVE
jgi:hypothetical protein